MNAGREVSGRGIGGSGGAFIGDEPPIDPRVDESEETLPERAALVGFYDVWLDDLAIPEECSTFIETNAGTKTEKQTHLNFAVRIEEGKLQGRLGWDFELPTSYRAASYEGNVLRAVSGQHDDVDVLELDVDRQGFVGTGRLSAQLLCDEEFRQHHFAVTVDPDVTPPRVEIASPARELERFFSHSGYPVRFSEPLTADWAWAGTFLDPAGAEGKVGLIDAETGAVVPVFWERATLTNLPVMRLSDRLAMEGRWVRVDTRLPAYDEAGNAWLADATPWQLHPSGPAQQFHDFSSEPAGLGNGARYFAPGEVGSPCESGGCVLLEGTTCERGDPACAQRAYLAVVNEAEGRRYGRARYRLLAKGDSANELGWSSTVIEGEGAGTSWGGGRPELLEQPWNGYTHAFDWATVHDGFYPASAEKPFVYLLPHHTVGEEPFQVAVVIDWVEATACLGDEC